MFEHRSQPLLPTPRFLQRLAVSVLLALAIVGLSLFAGMIGYHTLEKLPWLDAFINAAMLLGGMGPVNAPVTDGGKLFAGLYALYCGLVVIVVGGVMLVPVIHRVLHRFHLEKK